MGLSHCGISTTVVQSSSKALPNLIPQPWWLALQGMGDPMLGLKSQL